MIQPLGSQIIIRTLPQDSWKGIIIPDSAKGPTIVGEKGPNDAVHFVEAEVVAVGPGKSSKGDPRLADDMAEALQMAILGSLPREQYDSLLHRADTRNNRIPLAVKAGDRILYHPAVVSFDREIDGHLLDLPGETLYIIGEHSILAVIEE